MTHYIIAYICTAVIFLTIDFVWLGFVAKDLYFNQLGHLMLDKVNFPIAAGFYLMYAIGIVIFAVAPALNNGQWTTALIYGALFGFFAYATYDFTNMATLKDWPVLISIIDIAWGTVLTGTSATLGFFLSRSIIDKL